MQVQWSPNFKKKIDLARISFQGKKKTKGHLFNLFINAEVTPRQPLSIRWPFFTVCRQTFIQLQPISFFTILDLPLPLIPSLLRHRPRYSEAADLTQLSDWLLESIPLSRMWNYPREYRKSIVGKHTHERQRITEERGEVREEYWEREESRRKREEANPMYRQTEFCSETFIQAGYNHRKGGELFY